MLHLHTFAQSSASYRVRVVLAIKGLDWTPHAVSLMANEHQAADYLKVNPQGRVPALVTEQGVLSQSFAIMDWLEETYPDTGSIYPKDPWQRALCRAFAHVVATDIFPLQNLSTRRKLQADFGADDSVQASWSADWIAKGFAALETETDARGWTPDSGYLFGDTPTLADICLVPQMNNARRYKVDLTPYPLLLAADAKARAHPAFFSTAPETQAG
jgi:maleylacetoacetate isomerase